MLPRLLLQKLLDWKAQPTRKPLLLDGARQTGKTTLLQHLLGAEFNQVLRLDFLENPALADAFSGSLDPAHLINNILLLTGQRFNPLTDLLILDEIGECPRAVTSLKYFAEKAPTFFVAASGSNIGLLNTFPVGKVEQHIIRPLTFYEFLLAANEPMLIQAFKNQTHSTVAHRQLWDKLTDYYFTGGMPEAVAQWFGTQHGSVLERIESVSHIHSNLLAGYQRDFGKYAGKVNAQLIESVFNHIPAQLCGALNDSVKRFKFKQVHEKKSRYADFESAINWLHRCRLTLLNYPIEGIPQIPLSAYRKEAQVKLLLFDVGMLHHMLQLSYPLIKQQNFAFKGYIAENFIQQELAALGVEPSFSWNDARAEIEFIVCNPAGQVIPVEVKSGTRTQAKSLQSYIQKCQPAKTFKLTGTPGSAPSEQTHIVMPLYFAQHLPSRW